MTTQGHRMLLLGGPANGYLAELDVPPPAHVLYGGQAIGPDPARVPLWVLEFRAFVNDSVALYANTRYDLSRSPSVPVGTEAPGPRPYWLVQWWQRGDVARVCAALCDSDVDTDRHRPLPAGLPGNVLPLRLIP